MADNVAITAGTGTSIATDDVGGAQHQRVKVVWGVDGTINDTSASAPLPVVQTGTHNVVATNAGTFAVQVSNANANGQATMANSAPVVIASNQSNLPVNITQFAGASVTVGGGTIAGAQRVTIGTDDIISAVAASGLATPTTDVTRPNDTTAYAVNDCLSDSTSAPTSGGFTFTGAARASGKSGIITDLIVTTSAAPATVLQGEVWIFDTAVTNVNDNSAFVISDAESKTLVAKIQFVMIAGTNNSHAHVQNLAHGFTTVGSADLRYMVRVASAYTPVANEVFTFRLKCLQVN